MKTSATAPRIHLALAVSDLERSIRFYKALFGVEPSKRKPKYAKFEVDWPALNLALNESTGSVGPTNPVSHFGIQVYSSDCVETCQRKFEAAGLSVRVEEEVTCCYSVQNKVWVEDPDGHPWEVFVVLDPEAECYESSASECCSESSETQCCESNSTPCCQ